MHVCNRNCLSLSVAKLLPALAIMGILYDVTNGARQKECDTARITVSLASAGEREESSKDPRIDALAS
jgi:hypothetical protein